MNPSKGGQAWILLWDIASIHASEAPLATMKAAFPHDGIGAFDLLSRDSMLRGFSRVEESDKVLFSRQFCGSPSTYIWQDENGVVHVPQRGRQGTMGCADASVVVIWSAPCIGSCSESFSRGRNHLRFLGRCPRCVPP